MSETISDSVTGRSFSEALQLLGVTPEFVTTVSENESDLIPFPIDQKEVVVASSPIHGRGLFAARAFKKGEEIAVARIGWNRTPAGRFTNHSERPNAAGALSGETDVVLIATSNIEIGDEITTDYYLEVKNSRPSNCSVADQEEEKFITLAKQLFPSNLDEGGVAFANPLEIRQKILELEIALMQSKQRVQMETTHRFINGLYAREIFIPKGMLLVGKIHKGANISIMSKGEKLCLTEDGAMRVKAPYATIARPGIKRVGFALEDCIWTTIHATTERDLKKLDKELFCDSYDGAKFDESDFLTLFTLEG